MKKTKRTARAKRTSPPPCSASFVVFNINDYVHVKLTDYGRQCLRDNYDKLNAAHGGRLTFKHVPPQEDKDGWSRWQAWTLMESLGPHISIGMNPPFEPTIRVEVKMPTLPVRLRRPRRNTMNDQNAQRAADSSPCAGWVWIGGTRWTRRKKT